MVSGNSSKKELTVQERRMEGHRNGPVEILITPFEAEMLRVVLEAMKDCSEEETHSFRPHGQGRPLHIVEGREF